jgi:hypothetical protein
MTAALKEATVINLPRYRVKEAQVQRFEFDNTVWSVSVDAGLPFEEVLKPEFWANVVRPKNMKIGDELKVTPNDNSWRAHLLVRDCGAVWAKVGVLSKVEFEAQEESGDQSVSGFRVEWQGLANKHVVIREKDGAIIAKGFKTKPEAQIAMIEHARAVGA